MLKVMKSNNWYPTMFDEFFNSVLPTSNASSPAVNVKEDANAYTMEIAAPGIKKELCRVNIDAEGNLEVAIENKLEHKEEHNDENKHVRYLRKEFSYTNYQQTYTLPENVVKEDIAAKVEDGVLTITLPKVTMKEEKKIQRAITVG